MRRAFRAFAGEASQEIGWTQHLLVKLLGCVVRDAHELDECGVGHRTLGCEVAEWFGEIPKLLNRSIGRLGLLSLTSARRKAQPNGEISDLRNRAQIYSEA